MRAAFLLLVFLTLYVSPSFAAGKYYEQCLGKFDKHFSGKALEEACTCASKEAEKHQKGELNKEQYTAAVTSCISNTMSVTLEKKSFVNCIQSPQFKGQEMFEPYCSCLSKEYATQMIDLGMMSVSGAEARRKIHAIASANAHDQCKDSMKAEQDEEKAHSQRPATRKKHGK